MSLPIIQSLWIGPSLSIMEQLSISSFLSHGHEFHLYVYDDVRNIPNGAQLHDANNILPKKDIFLCKKNTYASFSDWFRWALLFKNGGLWVDLDVICLKPFDFEDEVIYGYQDAELVNVSVLGFPPNHEICQVMERLGNNPNIFTPYDSTKTKKKKLKRRLLRKGRSDIEWGENGPIGFTRALKHFELLSRAKPFTYFYPIHYSQWNSLFDNTLANDTALFHDTYAIHMWNEMIRNQPGFDKNSSFSSSSLYEHLKARFL